MKDAQEWDLPNSSAHASEEAIAALSELCKGGRVEVGSTFQVGDIALVIALAPTGHRCLKLMAHLPASMALGERGLKALYDVWVSGTCTLPREEVERILFAEVMIGDDGGRFVDIANIESGSITAAKIGAGIISAAKLKLP